MVINYTIPEPTPGIYWIARAVEKYAGQVVCRGCMDDLQAIEENWGTGYD